MATSDADRAPLLVVAALGRELAGLTRDANPDLVLLETGEGVANAERELEAWFERQGARAVLSIGFAGALSPALLAGDLVVADEVHDAEGQPDENLKSAAAQVSRIDGAEPRFAIAVTSSSILWRAESKHQLARSLMPEKLCFVDMESAAIARVCVKRRVPFLIVRAITDLFDEDLPLDFNLYRNRNGQVDAGKVMRAALLNPKAIAGLLTLQKRSRVCADRLAAFVRDLLPRIP